MADRSIEELRALLGAEADELTDADVLDLAAAADVFARLLVGGYRASCRAARDEAVGAAVTRRV